MKICTQCPRELGRRNVSGLCHSCSARKYAAALHTPEMVARRNAGVRKHFESAENRQRRSAHLAARHANMTDEEKARRSEWGRILCQRYLTTPEVRAVSYSPATRAKAGKTRTDRLLAWCPPELRDTYRALMRKRIPAVEARAILEAEIPGTVAHARRIVANNIDASRIREERRKAQEY